MTEEAVPITTGKGVVVRAASLSDFLQGKGKILGKDKKLISDLLVVSFHTVINTCISLIFVHDILLEEGNT